MWRIAARIAATVFCSGTKPADAPPTGDRYFGRPLRPAPVSWMKRAALAAAACAMASPSVSKASASAAVWKLPVDITALSSASTSGLSAALLSSISTASRACSIAASSAPWIDGMQRIDSGSCNVVGAARAAGKQVAQLPRRLLLSGGGPGRLQARVEDAAVGAESFHGQRAGLLLLAECRQRVAHRRARRGRPRRRKR